jgi:hypothetical protein
MGRGVIRDVSRFGVGILSEQFFEPGTVLAIQLRSSDHGFSGLLSATVIHASQQANGSSLLGCRLSRQLFNQEMDALLV